MLSSTSIRLSCTLVLAFGCNCFSAPAPDYSKEAAVIENLATKVRFAADGRREWQQLLSVRVQSEAAVRQFGVLAFSYSSLSEQVTVDYVHVKKADGSAIETPTSTVQDVATETATIAPTYSDLRQKQIPVKALAVGDLLEYSVHSVQGKPEFPEHFWFTQPFIDNAVVLNQTLEIEVPRDKYVQVTSPGLKGEVRDGTDNRVYTWKHSHLEPSKPDERNDADAKSPAVQITTFRNWEEVGNWWASLAYPESQPTPEIVEKAKKLTAGLSSDLQKEKAIYRYVSMNFRYISVSLGAGRYSPHNASDVLANQYGDCKDKHTLFVSLLRAAGIQAWSALVGVGMKFDQGVPSPAQFNHVITVIPQNGTYLWLDTTAEVAPFGFLSQGIRDENALVIPNLGLGRTAPQLVKTPLDPPFESSQVISLIGSLSEEGVLTGRFQIDAVGDVAVDLRSGFRQLAPAQWQALAQQISYAMNYQGEVSAVALENLEETDKPFRLSYEYKRKEYPGWKDGSITPPLPPLGFGPGSAGEKPKKPVWVGASGLVLYKLEIKLPKGFTATLPKEANSSDDFATYSSQYSFRDGELEAERKLVVKRAKLDPKNWNAYQSFAKALEDDQAITIAVSKSTGPDKPELSAGSSEAQRLMEQAGRALQAKDLSQARDLLLQVERLNPKQPKLWAMRSYIKASAGNIEGAISDAREEVQNNPAETQAYLALAGMLLYGGHEAEGIEVLQKALAMDPSNTAAAVQLASFLTMAKRYSDLLTLVEKPIAAAPEDYRLQVFKVGALLGTGRKDDALEEARRIAKQAGEPAIWNDLAYVLAENNAAVDLARELAEKAVAQIEKYCAAIKLDSLESADLEHVNRLASSWDSLGWVYYKQGEIPKAKKHLEAAWQLSQRFEGANHLGEIYEAEGRHAAAIHMWRLALAANPKDDTARERLRRAGAPLSESVRSNVSPRNQPVSPAEELGRLRTVKVPELSKGTGSAEFYVLISKGAVEDVRFISGDESLRTATEALRHADYKYGFADDGPEKIVRRGILACSEYTQPSCNLTFLLPSTVRLTPVVPKVKSAEGERTTANPHFPG